jgi:hypothetical protein
VVHVCILNPRSTEQKQNKFGLTGCRRVVVLQQVCILETRESNILCLTGIKSSKARISCSSRLSARFMVGVPDCDR